MQYIIKSTLAFLRSVITIICKSIHLSLAFDLEDLSNFKCLLIKSFVIQTTLAKYKKVGQWSLQNL